MCSRPYSLTFLLRKASKKKCEFVLRGPIAKVKKKASKAVCVQNTNAKVAVKTRRETEEEP